MISHGIFVSLLPCPQLETRRNASHACEEKTRTQTNIGVWQIAANLKRDQSSFGHAGRRKRYMSGVPLVGTSNRTPSHRHILCAANRRSLALAHHLRRHHDTNVYVTRGPKKSRCQQCAKLLLGWCARHARLVALDRQDVAKATRAGSIAEHNPKCLRQCKVHLHAGRKCKRPQ